MFAVSWISYFRYCLSFRVNPGFNLFVHFLLAQPRPVLTGRARRSQKTNQKRAPKMITSPRPYARYTSLIGASGRAEVRTIFGLPARALK